METPQKQTPKQSAMDLLKNTEIPNVYTNGFVANTTHSDAAIILLTNGKPVQVLNMSYTTLKSLAKILNSIVVKFEEKTGMDIMTMDVIKEKFNTPT